MSLCTINNANKNWDNSISKNISKDSNKSNNWNKNNNNSSNGLEYTNGKNL